MNDEEEPVVFHRVVAGVLVRDEQVLLCHRAPERKWYPDVWDLAGGHVENGELDEEALARELREELGITASRPIGAPIAVLTDTPGLSLTIYVVRSWEGDPVNRVPEEHSEIRWFDAHEIQHLPLAHPTLGNIVHTALTMSRHEPGAQPTIGDKRRETPQ